MAKKVTDDFDFIDDYYEEDDEFLYSQYSPDLSNVSYDDFNKVNEIVDDEDDDYDYEVETKKRTTKNISSFEEKKMEKEELMHFLSVFLIWFRRIGTIVAIIIIAYFLTNGLFRDLLLYFLLIVVSFFFGFGVMAIINKVMDNR